MAIGSVNTGGGGSGGTLTVNAPPGVTVTAAKNGKTYTRTANAEGIAVFKGLKTGIWSVTISDGVQNPATQQVQINADYEVTIAFFAAYIHVTYPAGSICKCEMGIYEFTSPDTSGSITFTVPETGDWIVSCTDGTDTANSTVTISEDGQEETIGLAYFLKITDFLIYLDENTTTYATLGTDYEIVYDDDTPIPQELWSVEENWKIRSLVNLCVKPLKDGKIDVFCVGGGAGGYQGSKTLWLPGPGGGYTRTVRGLKVSAGTVYPVVIGAGGALDANGGTTTAFGYPCAGGCRATIVTAQNGEGSVGGNGGNGGSYGSVGENYPRDGSDGVNMMPNEGRGVGRGQRNLPGPNGETGTTKEFGESAGTDYGLGGYWNSDSYFSHKDNTGRGGQARIGSSGDGTVGGSGIVVFRNAREAVT